MVTASILISLEIRIYYCATCKSYTKICENKDKTGLIKYSMIYILKTFSLTSICDFKNISQVIFSSLK